MAGRGGVLRGGGIASMGRKGTRMRNKRRGAGRVERRRRMAAARRIRKRSKRGGVVRGDRE